MSCSYIDHLTRVHPILRVERALDRAHDVERRTVLGLEVFHLAGADAVLAGARAAHRQRAADHSIVETPGLLELRGTRRIEDVDEVEVAVAGVTDQADREGGADVVLFRLDDALGET